MYWGCGLDASCFEHELSLLSWGICKNSEDLKNENIFAIKKEAVDIKE